MLKKVLLLALSGAALFAMHTAELNINEVDLEGAVEIDMGQMNHQVEPNTTFVGIRYLNADREEMSPKNVDVDSLIDINFKLKQDIKDTDFTVGLGVKSIFTGYQEDANTTSSKFLTIPLGVEVGYKIYTQVPVLLEADLYYAPKSLSLADATGYVEYKLEANVKVIPKGSVYFGYRNIETKYKTISIKYNKSAYCGFKFKF